MTKTPADGRQGHTGWERFRICEVPKGVHFFHTVVLLMPSRPTRLLSLLMLQDCCAVMAARWELRRNVRHSSTVRNVSGREFPSSPTGLQATWTIFQDTPIVRFHSCCATSASV